MSISRIDAELWALGELDSARAEEIERLRAEDEDLRAWTDGIKAHVADAADDLPLLDLPAEGATEPWWAGLLSVRSLALAGALAVVAVAFVLRPPPPTETFRGSIDIEVHLIRDGVAKEQSVLVAAQAGDRLQLRITTPKDGFVSVFDLQDDGELTEWMAPKAVRGLVPVDFAVLLDDYPGSERVFVVFAAEAIGRTPFERALQKTYDRPLAELDAVPGLDATQRSILLHKGTP